MPILSIKNLSCIQGIKVLFENATFAIEKHDKVAIVGPNGCGKSSLLKQIQHAAATPSKHISTQKGLKVAALLQEPLFEPEHRIQEALKHAQLPSAQIIYRYEHTLKHYQDQACAASEAAFLAASEAMDAFNLWDYEEQVTSVLATLGIHNLNHKLKDLSGGMRKKIALAQLALEDVDVLILDEPTNHLDIVTIEWLEAMIKKSKVTLLMVTHDRYFLDRLCSKIIEIDQQRIYMHPGNYQYYLEQRNQRYLAQEKQENRMQSILRVELEWLKRGPKARSSKQKARKDRIESMKIRHIQGPENQLELGVIKSQLGNKILELKNISKSFGAKRVVDDFSFVFEKGDKIGIIGPNGAGKTSLLNLIMQKVKPDSGQIDVGVHTKIAYFDQHSADVDEEATIYEYVLEIGRFITRSDGVQVSASQLLETFLFPSAMLKTPIKKLSGGEKRRLHLVCLLLKNPNFLLFDEPSNDFDIQTLSVLEDFLILFSGVIVIVSHDRYFMDRVVETLLLLKPDGKIEPFQGNYSAYAETINHDEKKPRQLRLKKTVDSKKEQQHKIKALEKEIEHLEKEKQGYVAQYNNMGQNDLDFEKLGKAIKALDLKIDSALAEWEALLETDS